MPQGISLHIGLNTVDPNAYNGWDGQLYGCINDATAMQALASDRGFHTTLLLDHEATADEVISAIGRTARDLHSGDIFLLTYSGHGGQVPDVNGDEPDIKDETWVLYDRMLIDDELHQLWSLFEAGVRIFILSDSCHSGTVARTREFADVTGTAPLSKDYRTNNRPRTHRAIPMNIQQAVYTQNVGMYKARQLSSMRGDRSTIEASILLISGCQDNQLSADGDTNGLFTGKLLEVWSDGAFQGNYSTFWGAIASRMPSTQSPNYNRVGQRHPTFESQKPFTIHDLSSSPSQPTEPSVQGPNLWSRQQGPPGFQVDPRPNTYYAFEITSQPELFDVTSKGTSRTPGNFYGSWSDNPHFSSARYTLPSQVWSRLKSAPTLYYRICTTSSSTGWDNYIVTTLDDEGATAKRITITDEARAGFAPPPQTSKDSRAAAQGALSAL